MAEVRLEQGAIAQALRPQLVVWLLWVAMLQAGCAGLGDESMDSPPGEAGDEQTEGLPAQGADTDVAKQMAGTFQGVHVIIASSNGPLV